MSDVHVCFFVFLICFRLSVCDEVPFPVFISSGESHFSHVVLDYNSQTVYVAAENSLYKLTSDLQILSSATTGPDMDSLLCTVDQVEAGTCTNSSITDNRSTVLQITELESSGTRLLLYCGVIKQGLCSIHDLSSENLHLQELDSSNPLNFAGSRKTTVAFFSSMTTISGELSALYAAVSMDERPLSLASPVLSARRLSFQQQQYNFHYVFGNTNSEQKSAIDIDENVKRTFIVNYVDGFQVSTLTFVK